jgi:hypothetical protein
MWFAPPLRFSDLPSPFSPRRREMTGLGGGGGAAAPGDYVYFKSVVPLHKISVSAGPSRTSVYDLPCLPTRARTSARRRAVASSSGHPRVLRIRAPLRSVVVGSAASPWIGSFRAAASLSLLVLFVLGSVLDLSEMDGWVMQLCCTGWVSPPDGSDIHICVFGSGLSLVDILIRLRWCLKYLCSFWRPVLSSIRVYIPAHDLVIVQY